MATYLLVKTNPASCMSDFSDASALSVASLPIKAETTTVEAELKVCTIASPVPVIHIAQVLWTLGLTGPVNTNTLVIRVYN